MAAIATVSAGKDASSSNVITGERVQPALLFNWLIRQIISHSPFMALNPVTRARLQTTLACVGALGLLWWRRNTGAAIATGLTTLLALVAWISPRHYAPVQRVLDRAIHLFMTVITWIVLAGIYLGVFMPVRLWRALTKHDPLQRRRDAAADTYLQPLPPASPGRFDRQF